MTMALIRDAATSPQPSDYLPPTNAGDVDPHSAACVAPEIHGSEGVRPIAPGPVATSDADTQATAEITHLREWHPDTNLEATVGAAARFVSFDGDPITALAIDGPTYATNVRVQEQVENGWLTANPDLFYDLRSADPAIATVSVNRGYDPATIQVQGNATGSTQIVVSTADNTVTLDVTVGSAA